MRFGLRMMSLAAILFGTYGTARNDAHPQSAGSIKTTPLMLEKSEGEHRVRRPRETPIPTASFTIKVDRKNGGSQKMWLGTEEIPPGGVIAKHKHLDQDEILLIQTGGAHVWLGTQERDVHAGAIVFIPSDTWISLKNTGNEKIDLAFVFSDPGYDEFMRCVSVPEGDASSAKILRDELRECQHKGHVAYEGFDSPAPH
ncbi:MAG TPA: cupin domain-containing protein [Candidatus Acidoferrum sp.]|nr:cupin domain-containing protein [Candidatus Acidoferrum sp.]